MHCDWALGKTAYTLSICPSSVQFSFLGQHVYAFLLLLPPYDSLGATSQDHFDGNLYLVIIFSAVTMKLSSSSHSLLNMCMSFFLLLLPSLDLLGATSQDDFDGNLYLVIVFSAIAMKLNTSFIPCSTCVCLFIVVAHLGFTWCYFTF